MLAQPVSSFPPSRILHGFGNFHTSPSPPPHSSNIHIEWCLLFKVDYTDTFRLFCTTRLPNPHYTPELSAKVTLVDFTVTMAGLEDQLLGKLILKEKHELEEQRQGLMEEVQSYKKKIKQLEDDLLFRLSNSQVQFLALLQSLVF